jgi:hypothetical protein
MNQEQFLRECGKSYPEAMAALAYFRRSVQQQCIPVVQKYLKEFAEVLGVAHKDLKLTEYADPDRPTPAFSGVFSLGWQAKRSDDLYLYFFLCWVGKPDENAAPWLNFGRLEIEVTVDDAKAYTGPWTVKLNQSFKPDTDLLETICLENERDAPHLVGK